MNHSWGPLPGDRPNERDVVRRVVCAGCGMSLMTIVSDGRPFNRRVLEERPDCDSVLVASVMCS